MVSKYCRVCMQSASYRIGSGLVSIKRGTLLCRSIPLVLLFFFFFFFFFFRGQGGGWDGEGQSTITMFQFLSQQEEQFLSQMFGLIKWFVDVIVSIPSLLGSFLESGWMLRPSSSFHYMYFMNAERKFIL